MTAVAAFPYLDLALLEYLLGFDIPEQCTVALLVTLLDCSYKAELCCQLSEAFLLGCLCKAVVHVCPLVVLTCGCSCKVLCCITDALQLLEPHLGMFLLVVGSCLEQCCYLLVAVLLCA